MLPFLPLPAAAKLSLAPGMMITSEAVLWLGGLLLGKEVIGKIKGWWLRVLKCFFPAC